MLDLYGKNSSWIGRQYRLPIPPAVLTQENIDSILLKEYKEKFLPQEASFEDLHSRSWSPKSMRVGAIGIKLGVSQMWDKKGDPFMVTLVQINDCKVIDYTIGWRDGGNELDTHITLGAVEEDMDSIAKMDQDDFEWYEKRGFLPMKKWSRFRVTADSLLPQGTEITASHFQVGQTIRCKGVSKDRGFQGVMKRWGMKGQPATHGQTKTHRKMGATGGGTDPGMIPPGKKMAGQMGGQYHTTTPRKIVRINEEYGVVYIRGPVPGIIGSFVRLLDYRNKKKTKYAVKNNFQESNPPPFPTHFRTSDFVPQDMVADEHAHDFRKESIQF